MMTEAPSKVKPASPTFSEILNKVVDDRQSLVSIVCVRSLLGLLGIAGILAIFIFSDPADKMIGLAFFFVTFPVLTPFLEICEDFADARRELVQKRSGMIGK